MFRNVVAYGELLNDWSGSLEWQLLECEHGLFTLLALVRSCLSLLAAGSYVEGCQLRSIAVEGIVVELDELL